MPRITKTLRILCSIVSRAFVVNLYSTGKTMIRLRPKGYRMLSVAGLFLVMNLSFNGLYAQDIQTEGQRKNTIKVDLTGVLFYRSSAVFSYERVTKPNQSFAITAGYQEFPKLTSLGDNIKSTKDLDRSGLKLGLEYRFYLAKENKFRAPHGVYIGPYVAYLGFNNERNFEATTESGEVKSGFLKTDLDVVNVGVQLGYQFVLNNRWTIDLVFIGPSISRYSAKMSVDGNFDIDEEELLQNEIIQRLVTKFPLLDDLIEDKTIEANGRLNSWSYGYRYQFLIGYHFGRK